MTRKTHLLRISSSLITILSVIVLAAPAQLPPKSQPSSTSIFLPPVAYQSGGQAAMSVAVADVNGDGNQDIVVSNACPLSGCSNTEALGLLLGNGDGTFHTAVTFGTGGVTANGLGTVAIADVNNDGKPDVLVTNACGIDSNCSSGSVGVLLGNGDGTFQTAVTHESGGYFDVSLAVADVNGDGKVDLVLANDCPDSTCAGEGTVDVLLGNGDGTFQSGVNYDSGGQFVRSVNVADINADGKPDLLVSNDCNSFSNCTVGLVSLLLGNGDGTFRPPVAYDSNGAHRKSVAVSDVNGDGAPDLVVANYCVPESVCSGGGPGNVDVLMGNGDGTFRSAVAYSSGNDADSVAVADVNGDGAPDLLVLNQCADLIDCASGGVSVLLGNGDGSFQAAISFSSGGYSAAGMAIADVNGDGRADLVVADYAVDSINLGSGALAMLLNNTADTTPPVITLSATGKVLRSSNGKLVQIIVSGMITDTGSGVDVNSAAFIVKDEDGEVRQRGVVTLGPGGKYSFTVLLRVSRGGFDSNGRRYLVTVRAKDNAGNRGSKTVVVTLPRNHGDGDD